MARYVWTNDDGRCGNLRFVPDDYALAPNEYEADGQVLPELENLPGYNPQSHVVLGDQRLDAFRADRDRNAFIELMISAKPEQIVQYIEREVTDLQGAKTLLRRIVLTLATIARP